MFRVKICGVMTPDDARMVAAAGADAVGLNFVPGSPRCLTVESARLVAAALPAGILRIGVFAGMDPAAARAIAESVEKPGHESTFDHERRIGRSVMQINHQVGNNYPHRGRFAEVAVPRERCRQRGR